MKSKLAAIIASCCFLAGATYAQVTNTYSQTANLGVTDDNAAGVAAFMDVSGFSGTVAHVSVTLNLTGDPTAWNGDYYVMVSSPNTNAYAVLMNRIGRGTGTISDSSYQYGYDDNGFNVTFSDTATNDIHYYQSQSYSTNGSGQLTGTWAADGRELDPQTNDVSVYSSTPQTATMSFLLSNLGGDPNGQWTLFLSDVSGGNTGTLVNWSIQISTVPEPGAAALSIAGGVLLLAFARRRKR